VDPLQVIQLIQSRPQEFRLDGGERLKFYADLPTPAARIGYVDHLLDRLSGAPAQAGAAT
jgi:transcription-repair coupling factor (superfamily II helicase)